MRGPVASGLRGRPIFLVRATHHDLQRVIRQRSCSAFALSHGARVTLLSVVRVTGIALEWIGSTTAFGAVVRKP